MIRKEKSGNIKGRSHSNGDCYKGSLVISLNWIGKQRTLILVICFWSCIFVEFTKTQKYDAKSYLCKVPYASSFLKLREKVRMKVRTFRTFCHFFETCVAFVLFDYGKKRRLSKPCMERSPSTKTCWTIPTF